MEEDTHFDYQFNDDLSFKGFIYPSNIIRTFPVQTKDGIVMVTLPKIFFAHIYFWRAVKKVFFSCWTAIYRCFETDRHRIMKEFFLAECKRCLDETWNELENNIMARGYDIFNYFHMLQAFRIGTPDHFQIECAKELGCRLDSATHTIADLVVRKEKVYNPEFYRKSVFSFLNQITDNIKSFCDQGMPTKGLKNFQVMAAMAEFKLRRDMALAEREVALCKQNLATEVFEEAKNRYHSELDQQKQEAQEQLMVQSMEKRVEDFDKVRSLASSTQMVFVQGNGNHVNFDHPTTNQTTDIHINSTVVLKGNVDALKTELAKIPELEGRIDEILALLIEIKDKSLAEKKVTVNSWLDSLKKKVKSGSHKVLETATINLILKILGSFLGCPLA